MLCLVHSTLKVFSKGDLANDRHLVQSQQEILKTRANKDDTRPNDTCTWLLLPDDQRDAWSVGLSKRMLRGW